MCPVEADLQALLNAVEIERKSNKEKYLSSVSRLFLLIMGLITASLVSLQQEGTVWVEMIFPMVPNDKTDT